MFLPLLMSELLAFDYLRVGRPERERERECFNNIPAAWGKGKPSRITAEICYYIHVHSFFFVG